MKNYSADSCKLCASAGATAPRCGGCGRRVAPQHLVVDVRRQVREDRQLVDRPFYPSGSPATGPTYWEPHVEVSRYSLYELTYADGHRDTTSVETRAPNRCDHCHLLDSDLSSTRSQLASLRYPEATIRRLRWGEVFRHAWAWALLSVIPLGIALAGIRSFPLLFTGMFLVGSMGGARSYLRQMEPIDEAREALDRRVGRYEQERQRLETKVETLAGLRGDTGAPRAPRILARS